MMRLLLMALGLFGFIASVDAADYGQAPVATTYGHFGGLHHGQRGYLPACDEAQVLSRIAARFAYADPRILHTGLVIEQIDGVRQNALRAGGPSLIDRRYCGGVAWLSNGGRSEVVYLIEAKQGFASFHWNVESCLPSFDPHRVYGAHCRAVRP